MEVVDLYENTELRDFNRRRVASFSLLFSIPFPTDLIVLAILRWKIGGGKNWIYKSLIWFDEFFSPSSFFWSFFLQHFHLPCRPYYLVNSCFHILNYDDCDHMRFRIEYFSFEHCFWYFVQGFGLDFGLDHTRIL